MRVATGSDSSSRRWLPGTRTWFLTIRGSIVAIWRTNSMFFNLLSAFSVGARKSKAKELGGNHTLHFH